MLSTIGLRGTEVSGVSAMWKEILQDYDLRFRPNAQRQVVWFQSQPSLRQAIEIAARATDERGRRYSHQRRIRRAAIVQATAALLAAEARIRHVASFDALLDVISKQLKEVPGIGELYRYDTACRIGAYLRIFPSRVYLHAGTRAGAQALNLDCTADALEMKDVPAPLRQRAPYEVEDILCIYKDRFTGDATTAPGCTPRRVGVRETC